MFCALVLLWVDMQWDLKSWVGHLLNLIFIGQGCWATCRCKWVAALSILLHVVVVKTWSTQCNTALMATESGAFLMAMEITALAPPTFWSLLHKTVTFTIYHNNHSCSNHLRIDTTASTKWSPSMIPTKLLMWLPLVMIVVEVKTRVVTKRMNGCGVRTAFHRCHYCCHCRSCNSEDTKPTYCLPTVASLSQLQYWHILTL